MRIRSRHWTGHSPDERGGVTAGTRLGPRGAIGDGRPFSSPRFSREKGAATGMAFDTSRR